MKKFTKPATSRKPAARASAPKSSAKPKPRALSQAQLLPILERLAQSAERLAQAAERLAESALPRAPARPDLESPRTHADEHADDLEAKSSIRGE